MQTQYMCIQEFIKYLMNSWCICIIMRYFVLARIFLPISERKGVHCSTKDLQLTICHYNIHNSLMTTPSCTVQWSETKLNSDQITNRIIKTACYPCKQPIHIVVTCCVCISIF